MNQPTHKRSLSPVEQNDSSEISAFKTARGAGSDSTAEHINTVELNKCDTADASVELQERSSHLHRFNLTSNNLLSRKLRISKSLRSACHHTSHFDFGKLPVLQVVQSVVEPRPLMSYRTVNKDALWQQERIAPRTSLGIFECNVAELMRSDPAMLLSLLETERRLVADLNIKSLSINDFVSCLKSIVSIVEIVLIHIRQDCQRSTWRFHIAIDSAVKRYLLSLIGTCRTMRDKLSTVSESVHRDVIFDFFRSFRLAGNSQVYDTFIHSVQCLYGPEEYQEAVDTNMQAKGDMHNSTAQRMPHEQQMKIGSTASDKRRKLASRLLLPHHILLLYNAILDQLYWWWICDTLSRSK